MGIKCKEVIFNPQYEKDKIVSLAMPNNYFITVGDKIKIKDEPYKVNIINKVLDGDTITYHLKTAERTKSSIFILPMLSGNKHLFLYDTHLVNAFIKYNNIEDHLILLYRWSSDPLFAKFDLALKKFPTFVKSFDPDPQHIVFIFSIPEEQLENFELFKQGKYSELEDNFKLKILDFHKMGVDSTLSKILFKAYERKIELEKKLDAELPEDSELLSIMNLETETLDLNYYL